MLPVLRHHNILEYVLKTFSGLPIMTASVNKLVVFCGNMQVRRSS